jgi:hypothetical protein
MPPMGHLSMKNPLPHTFHQERFNTFALRCFPLRCFPLHYRPIPRLLCVHQSIFGFTSAPQILLRLNDTLDLSIICRKLFDPERFAFASSTAPEASASHCSISTLGRSKCTFSLRCFPPSPRPPDFVLRPADFLRNDHR